MKVARLFGPRDLRVIDTPKPKPGVGEALCRVMRCGICGTDHSIHTGEFSFVKNGGITFPMTLGHEWSGVVAEIGEGVQDLVVGDRVVGDNAVSCGVCYDCLVGRYDRCSRMKCVGTINTWDGAFAEYILMPARHLFRLSDNISFDNGAMVEPTAIALYSVVLGEVGHGSSVLVHGTGPIGIMAAKLAKLSGAAFVAITGRKEHKLRIALSMGADVAINTVTQPVDEILRSHVGSEGFDCVIEASGSLELFRKSLEQVSHGGRIAVVAFYEKMLDGFDIDSLVFRNIHLQPVSGSLGMFKPVLRMMASGLLDASPLISGYYRLDDVYQAMSDFETKRDTCIKYMLAAE